MGWETKCDSFCDAMLNPECETSFYKTDKVKLCFTQFSLFVSIFF